MFARPLTSPLFDALPVHVFGRLLGSTAPAAVGAAAALLPAASADVAIPHTVQDDDAGDDLAQRVRLTGEW